MIKKTDQELIDLILNGDTNAFGELVDRYQNYVFTIAIRIIKVREEAEEIAQDSFIKAFDSLGSFRGESKFSTWLYRIVYHKSLDQIKKNSRHKTIEIIDEITEDRLADIENGLEFMLSKERSETVKKCIAKLPAEDAAIITLFYFDEQSVKGISQITDLTEDNIKIKLYRSRKKLFSLLETYIQPEISIRNEKAI
ncbi:RNA polymerase sigma factor [Christiangramia sabulilitoris]|uniref:RNA polymerase sigma factor n=1 Tax=Christiangramia sabulilitoris TaxID=2583991 RepID=A0A550HZ05_9FLAO|nr:RNA polymerase sigma factor [Christiangramia sabulilitoris]TRO63945.1 RNA polymerase sigma factor [Christiangramia sabulilitoris]